MKIKSCPFCGNESLDVGMLDADREGTPIFLYCTECALQVIQMFGSVGSKPAREKNGAMPRYLH